MWLGWEDALVTKKFGKGWKGLECKDLKNGGLFLKVEMKDGEVKSTVISKAERERFLINLARKLGGGKGKKGILVTVEIGEMLPNGGFLTTRKEIKFHPVNLIVTPKERKLKR